MRIISHMDDEFEPLSEESDGVSNGWAARVLEPLAHTIHILPDKLWNSPVKALNFCLLSWSCEEHKYKNVNQESRS
jgi:hypothetical protein